MSGLKPYADYKESGVEWLGKIPTEWQVCGIKFFGKTVAGSGFPHEYQGVEGERYPFLKVNALGRADARGLITSRDDSISESVAKKLGASIIPAGSVVLAKIGAALLLGRIRTLSEDSCIDNNMLSVQISKKAVSRFVFYAMQQIQFDLLVNPGAVPSLSERNFRSFKLPFPPLSEQKDIANFLDHETAEIDAFLADQEELIKLLNERRAATITQAVTRGLDVNVAVKESSLGWQGPVNATWPVVPLKLAGQVTLGKMLQSEQKNESDELRTYMRAANVQPDRLELSDQQQMWFSTREVAALDLRSGDVVVVEGGAGFGRSAFLTQDLDGWAFQNSINRIRPAKGCDGRYVNYVLKAIYASGYMDIVCNKATIPHLTAEKLEALRVPLPSHSEQNEVADYLDFETGEIDAAIADAKEAIDLSKERRAALISAAVTGKIDVRNHTAAELGAA